MMMMMNDTGGRIRDQLKENRRAAIIGVILGLVANGIWLAHILIGWP
jgi:hypothetical protein